MARLIVFVETPSMAAASGILTARRTTGAGEGAAFNFEEIIAHLLYHWGPCG